MTDPISDFLTRLRNASKARLDECVAPHSRMKEAIAAILKAEGYVTDFSSSKDELGHKTLVVKMKYVSGAPVLTGLTRAGAIPEPSAWALMLIGVAGIGGACRLRPRALF